MARPSPQQALLTQRKASIEEARGALTLPLDVSEYLDKLTDSDYLSLTKVNAILAKLDGYKDK